MRSALRYGVMIFSLLLAPAAALYGQQEKEKAKTPPVTEGMVARVIEIKHRSPEELLPALDPLTSGRPGSTMVPAEGVGALSVRDFPENVAAIEAAVRRLDVPRPTQPDVRLRMFVLIASSQLGADSEYPPMIRDVVQQLRATLGFKSYYLLTPIEHRYRLGSGKLNGTGSYETALPLFATPVRSFYRYSIDQILPEMIGEGRSGFRLENLNVGITIGSTSSAELRTTLTVREGERVVVGTAGMGDKAAIVILTAEIQ